MKNINYKNKPLLIITLGSLLIIGMPGCKKFLDVDTPVTSVSTASAYKDDASATAVITGIYSQLSNNYINGVTIGATSYYEELSADNLVIYDGVIGSVPDQASFYKNELDPTYTQTGKTNYWQNTYPIIYTINSSIENLIGNNDLTPAVAKRLLGETYFLRAFCYFYLTNLYGDVPLILTTNYALNTRAAKSPASGVYSQIVSDLENAENLLDNTYAGADVTKLTTDRIRPNLAAVNALQARVHLYLKDYDQAEASASKVITQSGIYSFSQLDKTFLKNSSEIIWALQPVQNNYNTPIAAKYLLPPAGPDNDRPVYISESLLKSFEPGDARKDVWIGTVTANNNTLYCYPNKYKIGFADGSTTFDEYSIVLRLAEQYLIRAEARNEQGNTLGAIEDLNEIRTRSRALPSDLVPAPLPNLLPTIVQSQIRSLIINERRTELFAEWGHRWFDLKRTNTIDKAMTDAEMYKDTKWASYKALYPIPASEILINPAITQNVGYIQ